MQFDSDDLAALAAAGDLLPVVLHEMGHVLGIGTIWERKELLRRSVPAVKPGSGYLLLGAQSHRRLR